MEAKLIKVLEHYHLYDGDKAIATTIVGNPMLLPNLSLKNCQAIENGYDLDEEISKIVKTIVPDDRGKDIWYGTSMAVGKLCFQKALEILGYKKCSEEDVRKAFVDAFQKCYEVINSGKFDDITSAIEWLTQTNADNYIQSLKQTEWDVEIVTTTIMENGKCGLDVPIIKPKLDADGYLILKRK